MIRRSGWLVWVLPLAICAAVPVALVKGDGAATSQPAKGVGSVTIKVVDAQGNAVSRANVNLMVVPPKHPKHTTGEKTKPQVVATGRTDADGMVVFSGIAEGSYRARAHLKTAVGHEDVTITPGVAASTNPTITITLQEKPKPQMPASQP